MNEFAFEYKYNCKYCSSKSSLQNLHENFDIFFMNIIVSIVQPTFQQKATFNYCDK